MHHDAVGDGREVDTHRGALAFCSATRCTAPSRSCCRSTPSPTTGPTARSAH
jgi:hypothetical protein